MTVLRTLMMLVLLAVPFRAYAVTDAAVIDGFNKTVFDSEYAGFTLGRSYVRKFTGPVRVYVRSTASAAKRARTQRFVRSLNQLIGGINVRVVNSEKKANFVVHLVRRREYASTVRNRVFKRRGVPVRGLCMVRSKFTREGITRSDAVIVLDEGEKLFKRCMTEEILQGLGPLNDDKSLSQSMFNDRTRFTTFRRFDRLILNMLYDRRIKPGMSRGEAKALLPNVLRRVRRRLARR